MKRQRKVRINGDVHGDVVGGNKSVKTLKPPRFVSNLLKLILSMFTRWFK